MKSLKKFFNLLPVVAISFISGLAGLLSNDQTINEATADYEKYPLHNAEFSSYVYYTYTDSSQLFPLTNTTSFTIDGTFSYYYVYTESGQQYSFSYNMRLRNCNSTYYQAFTITTTDRISQEYNVSSTITDFRLDLVSFEGISRRNDKIDVGFDFDIYLNGSKVSESSFVRTATLLFPSQSTGYSAFQGTPNQTIMNIHYEITDYDMAYADGYNAGYNAGFSNGYVSGQSEGYQNGYDKGYEVGVESQEQSITNAFNDGYQAGYAEGYSVDTTVATIFSGVLQVGMLPVNVFLAIFNFEILGINLSAFIGALLTVCLTVIVIRTIKGGGSSD